MNYHKTHRKKQFLAMFLTGSLMLSGIPVYAAQDTDMDLSVDTTESDDDFSVSSSDDTNLTVDFDDPETAPDTSEIPDSNSDTITDFSSENNDALFSSGTDSDSDTEPDYILGRPMTEEERQAQLAPLQNLVSFSPEPEVNSDLEISSYALYPDTYDARSDGLVTSVKDQSSLNLCWAFSLASNFETSLLNRGLGTWDLSEEHLAYFWAHRVNDPLGNTPDDNILRLTNNSFPQNDYHSSGNGRVASFFLSTWSGMSTEEKVPLNYSAVTWPDSLAYDTDVYMQDAVFSAYDVERTKALLEEYHSVAAMIYMDLNGTYYNADTAAASYPRSGSVNHAVTIVGWDDNYKKENFTDYSNVQNNGAWIVKNSYGTNWGDNGYFYLSYEDQSIANLVCNTAVTQPAYANNYFYDGACVGTISFPASKPKSGYYYVSNVFKTTADTEKDEALGEIVTAVPQDNTTF